MNKAILMGRLTRDLELRNTQSNIPFCQFTLAVDRRFKNAQGERQTDFIDCIAWRQTAEFLTRYFRQGSRLLVVGSIQTSSWEDQNGQRQYRTNVAVDEAYFADGKAEGGRREGQNSGSNYGQSYGRGASAGGSTYQNNSRSASPAPQRPASVPEYKDAFSAEADDDMELPFDL